MADAALRKNAPLAVGKLDDLRVPLVFTHVIFWPEDAKSVDGRAAILRVIVSTHLVQ